MPFLYNPEDNGFEAGDFRTSRSHAESNINAQANTSARNAGSRNPLTNLTQTPMIADFPYPVRIGASSMQVVSESLATRSLIRRILVDVTGHSTGQPSGAVSLAMSPSRLSSVERAESSTVLTALLSPTEEASLVDQIRQVRQLLREHARALAAELAQARADQVPPVLAGDHDIQENEVVEGAGDGGQSNTERSVGEAVRTPSAFSSP